MTEWLGDLLQPALDMLDQCATCRTRAKGVAEADSYGPGRFGIRYH